MKVKPWIRRTHLSVKSRQKLLAQFLALPKTLFQGEIIVQFGVLWVIKAHSPMSKETQIAKPNTNDALHYLW